MTKGGKRTDQRAREDEARDRAAHGQSAALGDTGDRQTGVEPAHQGISNRSGDRPDDPVEDERNDRGNASPGPREGSGGGEDGQEETRIDRTAAQDPPRRDPEAVRPLGSPSKDDNTM